MVGIEIGSEKSLPELLNITKGSIVAVVGCGGKTSLIEKIANDCKDMKVLITPTTKILHPKFNDGQDRGAESLPCNKEFTVCNSIEECKEHESYLGVQYFGQLNEKTNKLEALHLKILAKLVPKYDVVLMEADGSRGLLLKGWKTTEPVVPDFATHTIGVINIDALGKLVNEDTVFNLPEFLELTSIKENDQVTMQTLEDMAFKPGGMFKNSRGQKYLVMVGGSTWEVLKIIKL